ncbi:MAG: hypothetical protein RIE73_06685 [Coleofasciculus sp. C1-SOL-03]|jgi:pimeloyl-ACP methyl ester carboxylesterase|uniref:hypothetical protein n=1 Tax=Coleofasciculus sp. C1-SOL-03 TaxID=3069522 RepID=UPI0032FEF5BD
MTREILSLDPSGRQVRCASHLNDMPIVSLKASSFFMPSILTVLMPLKAANQLRDRIHDQLAKLSTNCVQIPVKNSGHFVWVDRPDAIIQAVKLLLEKLDD